MVVEEKKNGEANISMELTWWWSSGLICVEVSVCKKMGWWWFEPASEKWVMDICVSVCMCLWMQEKYREEC